MLHLILCSVVLMAALLSVGSGMVIVGIHRSEHRRRLTGRADGFSESVARRMLVGSRGCRTDDARDGRR